MLHRGLRDSRCQADEKYLIAVSSCSEAATNKLVVFTEQYVFFLSFFFIDSETNSYYQDLIILFTA